VSWVYTFLGFAALIILHEAGHFVAAKAVGMRVDRFSLFFGPMIFKVRRGETEYGIGTIPLGGYVKIFGMNPYELEPAGDQAGTLRTELGLRPRSGATDGADEDGATSFDPQSEPRPEPIPPEVAARAFFRQPVWKRVVVIAAGPAVNAVLALVILWVVFMTSAQYAVGGAPPQVASVNKGAPATGVLRAGDVILRADGKPIAFLTALDITRDHPCANGAKVNGCRAATPVQLLVRRDRRDVNLTVYPRYNSQVGRMLLGFTYEPSQFNGAGPGNAFHLATSEIGSITSKTVDKVSQIFTSSKARKQLNSVVGASDVISEEFSYSSANAFFVLAVVSLSLAIINLFPFLPLDGGHIFWALAEKVRGRAIPFSIMERASMLGFALVLFVFLIGFTNDVHTLSHGGFHVR
jgi:regulator of sigma E protease